MGSYFHGNGMFDVCSYYIWSTFISTLVYPYFVVYFIFYTCRVIDVYFGIWIAKSLVAQLVPFGVSNGDVLGLNPPPPTIKLSKTLVFELKVSKVINFHVVTGSWDIESCKQESETSGWDCFTTIGVMENVFRNQCCSNGQKFLHCVYWNGIWTCSSKGMFVFSSLHLF